jgi:hypothetical protein
MTLQGHEWSASPTTADAAMASAHRRLFVSKMVDSVSDESNSERHIVVNWLFS